MQIARYYSVTKAILFPFSSNSFLYEKTWITWTRQSNKFVKITKPPPYPSIIAVFNWRFVIGASGPVGPFVCFLHAHLFFPLASPLTFASVPAKLEIFFPPLSRMKLAKQYLLEMNPRAWLIDRDSQFPLLSK